VSQNIEQTKIWKVLCMYKTDLKSGSANINHSSNFSFSSFSKQVKLIRFDICFSIHSKKCWVVWTNSNIGLRMLG